MRATVSEVDRRIEFRATSSLFLFIINNNRDQKVSWTRATNFLMSMEFKVPRLLTAVDDNNFGVVGKEKDT